MTLEPPSLERVRRSDFSSRAYTFKISRYAPALAVTDLLVGSLRVPLSAFVGLLVSYQILIDHYICMMDFVAISSTVILTICSIFHLTMMAWERYVAIRKWIDYKVMVSKSLMKKLALIAWVAAIVTVEL